MVDINADKLSGRKYYKEHIKGLLDDTLRRVVENIEADRTYVRRNQPEPWLVTVPRICSFIATVVFTLYKADAGFTDFFNIGYGVKRKTVGDMVEWIETLLEARFHTSPPFTILHFVETMVFLTEGLDRPLERDLTFDYDGLKFYRKKVNNLVCDEQCDDEVMNMYYEEQETCEYSTNNIYAVKYLRALINILSVESSVDEVMNDLDSFRSQNALRIEGVGVPPPVNDDGSANYIKMTKIPWHDDASVLPGTTNEDDGKDPV